MGAVTERSCVWRLARSPWKRKLWPGDAGRVPRCVLVLESLQYACILDATIQIRLVAAEMVLQSQAMWRSAVVDKVE
jgi:hypothetical protein